MVFLIKITNIIKIERNNVSKGESSETVIRVSEEHHSSKERIFMWFKVERVNSMHI